MHTYKASWFIQTDTHILTPQTHTHTHTNTHTSTLHVHTQQAEGMQRSGFDIGPVGQTEMAKTAKGMLVAFIDFTKTYDIVD